MTISRHPSFKALYIPLWNLKILRLYSAAFRYLMFKRAQKRFVKGLIGRNNTSCCGCKQVWGERWAVKQWVSERRATESCVGRRGISPWVRHKQLCIWWMWRTLGRVPTVVIIAPLFQMSALELSHYLLCCLFILLPLLPSPPLNENHTTAPQGQFCFQTAPHCHGTVWCMPLPPLLWTSSALR